MSSQHNIPRPDATFDGWQANFMHHLGEALAHYGLAPEAYARLAALQGAWQVAWLAACAPQTRTRAAVTDKNDARRAYESALRATIRQHVTNNAVVTHEDQVKLGLPIHKTGRTRAPVPQRPPWFRTGLTGVLRQIAIHFSEKPGPVRARPLRTCGAELRWGLTDDFATLALEQLPHTALLTKSPHVLTFGEGHRGCTAHFALRWVNTRGEPGPWSEIHTAIVP